MLSAFLLYRSDTGPTFFVSIALLNALFSFVTPYAQSCLASWDGTGRAATFGTLAYTSGTGLGPGVMAVFVAGESFFWVFIVSGGILLVVLLLLHAAHALSQSKRPEMQSAQSRS